MRRTPRQALERILREVRLRATANVVLRQAAWVLLAAGVAAIAAVLAEKLFAVRVVMAWTAGGLAGCAAAAVAALSVLRAPGRMESALLADRRLAFRERFSTALALAASEDPFAQAAEREAHQAAERLNVAGRFPIRPTGHWLGTLAAWLAAAGVLAFLPQMDVLGHMARQKAQQQQAAQDAEAKADVQDAAAKVKAVVEQVKDPQIAAELDKLGELTAGLKAADVRREAIHKLGDLADRLQELQKTDKVQTADQTRDMLRGLKTTPDALKNDLNRALANGDFAAVSKMLQDLLQQVNDGKLSEEDQQKLARQLQNLAQQLTKLGDEQKRTEESLRQEGMDPNTARNMAGLSEKDLREALKKEGLTDEQIDQLMEKLSNARQACKNGQGLSQSLGKCSGNLGELLPDGLVGLVENLDSLSQSDQGRAGLEEALREIEGQIARLGQGQCPGGDGVCDDPNAAGLWIPDESDKQGQGPGGGRARAWGQRPVGGPEDTGIQKTGLKNQPNKEDQEIIASWLYKGPQAKGVSKRELSAAVRAAKDTAAEAIQDNKIPRKYENAVKKYFGDFGAGADANQP